MRAPWHPDWGTCDEEEHARIYHPYPINPPWPEVTVMDDEPGLLGPDGEPLPVTRIPFGFQPPPPPTPTPENER